MDDANDRHLAPDAAALVRRHAGADRFVQHLGARLLESGAGHVTLQMLVLPQHLNFNGTCHGGAIFGLADAAFGLASNSHGPVAAGIDAHVVYAAAAREGEVLTARAWQITDTPRLATYRVDVTNGEGDIVAAFTGTVYVTRRQHGTGG